MGSDAGRGSGRPGEPGAFETFVNETQGRSSDEMSAAALVLFSPPDVEAASVGPNLESEGGIGPVPALRRVSFAGSAGKAVDASLPLGHRVNALCTCLEHYSPVGYEESFSFLRCVVANS